MVGCGRVFPTTEMIIVDPDTRRRCAADEVGEIWVNDPAVTQGYWGRPDETKRTFQAPAAAAKPEAEAPAKPADDKKPDDDKKADDKKPAEDKKPAGGDAKDKDM